MIMRSTKFAVVQITLYLNSETWIRAATMASDSLWNWLGRQIGHVKKAVTTDVTKPKAPASLPAQPPPEAVPDNPKVIYRDEKAEEVDNLERKITLTLRRHIVESFAISLYIYSIYIVYRAARFARRPGESVASINVLRIAPYRTLVLRAFPSFETALSK